ncbi:MAG: cellobiose phosphorylase [Spirochaetaceae bacterium]|nr:MAG: cellobiose phosphorylase [Spirochaetaceae bacterium]
MDTLHFVGDDGDFALQHADGTTGLYFPIANEAGYLGAIDPRGGGDAKTDQNHFLMPPVSSVDLHNSRFVRTCWLDIEGYGPWSVTGASHDQKAAGAMAETREEHTVSAGPLWHTITRQHQKLPITAEMTTFSPAGSHQVELTRITITNDGDEAIQAVPTFVVPLYGRSADSIRDHRHVTSLLHRAWVEEKGVFLSPTMSFDERGHAKNTTVYAVMGADDAGQAPLGAFPDLNAYIGEGGDFEAPRAIYDTTYAEDILATAGDVLSGCEVTGALRFSSLSVAPSETRSFVFVSGVFPDAETAHAAASVYLNVDALETALTKNRAFWTSKLDVVACSTGDRNFDCWMRWVALQPILRRLYGCSFLPHHDYGRGGRGWRDLWQDCLALLLMEPAEVRDLLLSNLAGVRLDGTNATIIGNDPGEFIADRNNISRVWMDHGAWPLVTVQLYVDRSGDTAFLLEDQRYFSDRQWARATEKLELSTEGSTVLQTQDGRPYAGTVLEHLLVQNLSAFFNVGDHNTLRLEGADWNDALDMAADGGESVAFSGLYAANLKWLSTVVLALAERHDTKIEIAEELLHLLDRYSGAAVSYDDPAQKRAQLQRYFDTCRNGPSGTKVAVDAEKLSADLAEKSDQLSLHIRNSEWIETEHGGGWFNGYYDNAGRRVEGQFASGVRMTLTGQVFQIMSDVASDDQVDRMLETAQKHLWDPSVGGYRLNTDFAEVKLDLGRCFGFAYGHKENGAMFSHMAVMFANALYRRGRTREAWRIMKTIYTSANDFTRSRMYPGIPEYFDPEGRGLYSYLTGSASWYLLTVITLMFGVRGELGDLVLQPQLLAEQWGPASTVKTRAFFGNRPLTVEYHNPDALDVDEYTVKKVHVNGIATPFQSRGTGAQIAAGALPEGECHVSVELGRRV